MSKPININNVYENLVESYLNARNRAGNALLEMANICLKAKEQLKRKEWLEWLKDPRIKLRRSQAMKFIAVAKTFNEGVQSTGFLNQKGIEEAYLLTRIKDDSIREMLAKEALDADFTVKQTRTAVKKIQKENKPLKEVISEVKNLPKASPKKAEKTTVSKEVYEKLKTDYELLLKQKEELEKQLEELKTVNACQCSDKSCSENQDQSIHSDEVTNNNLPEPEEKTEGLKDKRLKEPVETELEDGIINEKRHSITYKGYELPLPDSYANITKKPKNILQVAAINRAKVEFNLALS
jgi:hypothetical protein